MVVADHHGVVACCEATASAVFTSLCHLTGGDVERALDLTIETYRYLERLAVTGSGVEVDRNWMIAAAHSVFAADRQAASTPAAERVALSLRSIERWEVADIAHLLGVEVPAAEALLASATAALGPVSAEATLRADEVWFDDSMRSDVRAAVASGGQRPVRGSGRLHWATTETATQPWSPAEPSEPTSGDGARPRRSRRTIVAALVATAAALGVLAVWVRPSGTDRPDASGITDPPTDASDVTTEPQRPSDTTTPFTVDPSGAAGLPAVTDPAASDTTPSDTTGDSATTAPVHPAPLTGYVVDSLPPGFQAGGGYADGRDSVQRRSWIELWSTAEATHTSGRWFAVVVVDDEQMLPSPEPAADAQRIEVGGRRAIVRTSIDGVLSLTVQLAGRQHGELRSFGLSMDELVQLAAAIEVGDSNRPTYAPTVGTLFMGMEVRVSEPTDQSLLGFQAFNRVETTSFYVSADGNQSITVNSGSQSPNDLLVSQLLNPALSGPAAAFAPGGVVVLDGIPRITGTIADTQDHPDAFVQWHDRDNTVTVMGNVTPEQLFEVARTSRHATVDEWLVQTRARPVFTSVQPNQDDANAATEIGSNSTALGPTWTMSMTATAQQLTLSLRERRAPDPASTGSALYGDSETWLAVQPDPANPVLEYDSLDATIVVVILQQPPEMSKIRFTLEGSAPEVTGLFPISGTPYYAAAYAFSETTHYSVDLVDISGSRLISTLRP